MISYAPFVCHVSIKIFRLVHTTSFAMCRYLHSNVEQYSDPSSLHRLARVKQLPQPANSNDILGLLGDTNDPDYPIYCAASGPDTAATLATGRSATTLSIIYNV